MHPRHRQPVPGHADEADEALVARLDCRLERAAFAQGGLPFDHVHEVVQLNQVDVVDAEPVERAPDLLTGSRELALAGLRREEYLVAVVREPRCEAQLRVSVRRGRVDVVDAALEDQLERAVRFGLRDGAERGGSEDRARALVAGAPERCLRDHSLRLVDTARVPYDLIAVGDVMLDGALPAPVLGGRVHGRIELRVGGSAANAALAAARLGARAAVVGRVGADAAGRLVAEELAAAGVEPLLARDDAEHTGSVVVVGATSIVADPGASARLAPDDLPEVLEAGAVLVSGYSLLQRGSEPAARAALERARTDWLAVDVASPRLVEAFGADRFFDATRPASVLLANATEARTLTGLEPEEAAAVLASHYRVVCIKLGRDGALAVRDRVVVRAEVEPIERTDTLGTGDAFAGGFLFGLVGGAELAAALRAGCDSAALTLRRP